VACIGVLIRDAGNSVIGGLSISAPRERHESHWIGLLVEAGKRISQRMGYNADNPHLQQK